MATKTNKGKLCKQPKSVPRKFKPGVTTHRQGFILSTGLKWVNGTEIKYFFLEGAEKQRKVVRQAFDTWKALGIGISFKEVKNAADSMVRIGFDYKDGSWSYVGREILDVPKSKRTMNFGWDLTADDYGMTTAVHEIGHTVGFQHEHQSPFSGIEWNEKAVYAEFSGPENYWSKSEIESNILSKLQPNQVEGSVWDPKSIMEYEFGPGLIVKPAKYAGGINPPGLISVNDKKGVRAFYPQISKKSIVKLTHNKLTPIKSDSGGQDHFTFTAPATQKYTFKTEGELDTVMVIFEKGTKENHYMSGDDDSGLKKNSKIKLPLVKGREYLINLRVMYAPKIKAGQL